MTGATAASAGVTAFKRRAGANLDRRRAIGRAVVVGFGTATAAGLMAGLVTMTAASIVALALGAAPHLDATTPLGPKTSALASPARVLADGAAKFAGLVRV